MDEQEALLKELKLQNKKLQRENRRLQAECDLLKELNEKVSRTQEFFQRDNQRQLCYNNQLLKTSPYIVLMVNEKLETVMASDVFFDMTEMSRDAVKEGIPLSEAFSGILKENELQSFLERCESILESQGADSYLLTSHREKKEIIYQVEICYYLAQNEDAKGLSIILSDMTEIVEAKEKAENADKAKSSFLASMSHEIRTPINAVLGMNEMILREAKDASILEYSSNIRTAGRTLLSLINSILDFSKIEEGKMEIIPVEYDTASVINNLVVSISERARQKGLEFQADLDTALPSSMIGDDVRISQVVMNLLTNAVKYTEKGSVKLSIHGGERCDGEIVLRVSVSDTGIGIRQEDIPKLYKIFERLDEVRNHSIEGTGLGISIVTKLLRLMGSQLNVESVYGEGSVFSFEIIQKIADETPVGDYAISPSSGEGSSGSETLLAEESRILVVDDNKMNLKVAKNLFKLFGITPDLAESGSEAIRLLEDGNQYHMIFLDHMMPEMDGIATLRNMKQKNLLPDSTSAIALTANAINGAKERYLSLGFDGYLSKPIEVERLEHILARFLPEELCSYRKTEGGGAFGGDHIMELTDAGFDTAAGLSYSADDRDFYLELVRDFADGCDRNLSVIRSDYEKEDWPNYQIRVHALKTTSRQIGANELSELALAQELSAGAKDVDAIQSGAGILFSKYEEVCQRIRDIMGIEEPGSMRGPSDTSSTDSFVMEFSAAQEEGQEMSAEEVRDILSSAMEKIHDFEAESAQEILKPLLALPADALPGAVSGSINDVMDALSDFDTMTAEEKLGSMLKDLPA